MLNSFKKWVGNDKNAQQKQPPGGLHTMRSDLQKKFSKGVQYNLKIIIRGDRNCGKTCLWHRLQGHKFTEEYVPTPEIQVTSIHWNYKATDDIVKVDVWDVVDKGKPKQSADSLKLAHQADSEDPCSLDASFLDVYKGAHAVLMVFDITKKWTFQYIERELPKVPPHIPVLVLANHRDMGGHRVISLDEVQGLVKSIERPTGSANVFFLESSMKSGFGLKYIHKFFNLPFLLVQRESLLKQLETNHLDVESCLEELEYESTSEEQSYDSFLLAMEEKRNHPKKTTPTVEVHGHANGKEQRPNTQPSPARLTMTTSPGGDQPSTKAPPRTLTLKEDSTQNPPRAPSSGGLFSPSMMSDAASPTEQTQTHKEPEKKGFMSRFFRGSSKPEAKPSTVEESPVVNPATVSESGPVDLDKFVPDVGSADNFLDEVPDPQYTEREDSDPNESSSDEDVGNPMVAGFQEELDSDDQVLTGTHKVYSYSDSDDDYVTTPPRPTFTKTPVSSRSISKSRVSPEPRVEDSRLQHLQIGSDESSEEMEMPVIMADDGSVSGVSCGEEGAPNVDERIFSDDLANEASTEIGQNIDDKLKPRDMESSSEEEAIHHKVSTIVEDVESDDEDLPVSPSPKPPEEEKFTLNLQTSDLDFLEQITTAPQPVSTSSEVKKSDKAARKPKKKNKEVADDGDKKRKHKKKKSGKELEAGDAKSGKKRSKKKSADDRALEQFLASGDNSL